MNEIEVQFTGGNGQRGLHVVIIEPRNGQILLAKVFDTHQDADTFDRFIVHGLPEGTIVVAACKDDCSMSLSEKAKQWFANMGSEEIWKLRYRFGFAFIGFSGRKQANEKRAMEDTEQPSVT